MGSKYPYNDRDDKLFEHYRVFKASQGRFKSLERLLMVSEGHEVQ